MPKFEVPLRLNQVEEAKMEYITKSKCSSYHKGIYMFTSKSLLLN